MRPPIRKQLVTAFQRDFEKLYPQFSLLKLPSSSTLTIWAWSVDPRLAFYVALSPFKDEDSFALEVAWSEDGEFPWTSFGQVDVEAPARRERLGRLWARHGKEPVWDAAPEVATAMQGRFDAIQRGEEVSYPPPPAVEVVIPRIARLVDDCLQKFREYALPLFNQVAQHRGLGNVLKPIDS